MLNRTRVGMMIRAGVDDRAMLSATGVNVHVVFAIVFALGAGLAGFAGVVGGSALSVAPGEDVRYLLASLVVVIVGGMGSITGAAIGALLIGLAEQIGLVYFPTYGIVLTFVIMVAALAIRPQGIMGKAAMSAVTASRRRRRPARNWLETIGVAAHRAGRAAHRLSGDRLQFLPHPDRRLFADPRHDRAVADAACRLWRHGQPGADQRRRHRRLCRRRSSASTIPACIGLRLAVLGRGAVRHADRGSRLGADRLDLGQDRGHLHDHDHAGDRHRLLLFRAAELFAVQRLSGFTGIRAPEFWGVNWRDPLPFYYLCLACAALAYRGRALRLALDLRAGAAGDPRQPAPHARARLRRHRASRSSPISIAGLIAGLAGVLLVWFNGRISPGTVNVAAAINVLIIAVIGGMRHPIGPFIGAVVVVLMQTFAIDIVGAERFNTLIGLFFLAIVFVSPDGLLGLWGRIKPHLAQESLRSGP